MFYFTASYKETIESALNFNCNNVDRRVEQILLNMNLNIQVSDAVYVLTTSVYLILFQICLLNILNPFFSKLVCTEFLSSAIFWSYNFHTEENINILNTSFIMWRTNFFSSVKFRFFKKSGNYKAEIKLHLKLKVSENKKWKSCWS